MSFLMTRLEMYKIVRHPVTGTLIALSTGLMSLFFYRLCVDYLLLSHDSLYQRTNNLSLSLEVIKPLCSWTIVILATIFPLLTSQTLSQEFRQRTFCILATSPLSNMALILGKFYSLIMVLLFLLFTLFLMITSLSLETTLDCPFIFSNLIAVGLMGICFISFNLFIASLITHPLLATGCAFLGNFLWMLLEWLNPFGNGHLFAKEFSLLSHSYHFLNGIFYSPDILYYFLFSIFWLFLTYRVMRQRKLRTML